MTSNQARHVRNILRPDIRVKGSFDRDTFSEMVISYDAGGWVKARALVGVDDRRDRVEVAVIEDSVDGAIELLAHRCDLLRQAVLPEDAD